MKFFSAVYVVLLICTSSYAVEYTVGPSGADYNDIQTALDALPAGGGKVIIKHGRYIIKQTIMVPSNTILEGSGRDTIFEPVAEIGKRVSPYNRVIINTNAVKAAEAFWNNWNCEPGVKFEGSGDANITIRNLTVDGKRAGTYHKDAIYGIDLVGCYDCVIEHCYVENITGEGILTSYTPAGAGGPVIIRYNTVINSNHGLNPHYTNNVRLIGNTLRQNQQLGIFAEGVNEILIDGNLSERNKREGIVWMGGYNIPNSQGVMVSNNVCANNGSYGIYVYGQQGGPYGTVRDVQIIGNTSLGNGADPIKISEIYGTLSVIGNTVSQSHQEPISITNCLNADTIVKDNSVVVMMDSFSGLKKNDSWSNKKFYIWNDGVDDRVRHDGEIDGPYKNNFDYAHTLNVLGVSNLYRLVWEVELFSNPEQMADYPAGGFQHGLQWSRVPGIGAYECILQSSTGKLEYYHIIFDYDDNIAEHRSFAVPAEAGQFGVTKSFKLKIVQGPYSQDIYLNNVFVGHIDNSKPPYGGGLGLKGVGIFDNVKVMVEPADVKP